MQLPTKNSGQVQSLGRRDAGLEIKAAGAKGNAAASVFGDAAKVWDFEQNILDEENAQDQAGKIAKVNGIRNSLSEGSVAFDELPQEVQSEITLEEESKLRGDSTYTTGFYDDQATGKRMMPASHANAAVTKWADKQEQDIKNNVRNKRAGITFDKLVGQTSEKARAKQQAGYMTSLVDNARRVSLHNSNLAFDNGEYVLGVEGIRAAERSGLHTPAQAEALIKQGRANVYAQEVQTQEKALNNIVSMIYGGDREAGAQHAKRIQASINASVASGSMSQVQGNNLIEAYNGGINLAVQGSDNLSVIEELGFDAALDAVENNEQPDDTSYEQFQANQKKTRAHINRLKTAQKEGTKTTVDDMSNVQFLAHLGEKNARGGTFKPTKAESERFNDITTVMVNGMLKSEAPPEQIISYMTSLTKDLGVVPPVLADMVNRNINNMDNIGVNDLYVTDTAMRTLSTIRQVNPQAVENLLAKMSPDTEALTRHALNSYRTQADNAATQDWYANMHKRFVDAEGKLDADEIRRTVGRQSDDWADDTDKLLNKAKGVLEGEDFKFYFKDADLSTKVQRTLKDVYESALIANGGDTDLARDSAIARLQKVYGVRSHGPSGDMVVAFPVEREYGEWAVGQMHDVVKTVFDESEIEKIGGLDKFYLEYDPTSRAGEPSYIIKYVGDRGYPEYLPSIETGNDKTYKKYIDIGIVENKTGMARLTPRYGQTEQGKLEQQQTIDAKLAGENIIKIKHKFFNDLKAKAATNPELQDLAGRIERGNITPDDVESIAMPLVDSLINDPSLRDIYKQQTGRGKQWTVNLEKRDELIEEAMSKVEAALLNESPLETINRKTNPKNNLTAQQANQNQFYKSQRKERTSVKEEMNVSARNAARKGGKKEAPKPQISKKEMQDIDKQINKQIKKIESDNTKSPDKEKFAAKVIQSKKSFNALGNQIINGNDYGAFSEFFAGPGDFKSKLRQFERLAEKNGLYSLLDAQYKKQYKGGSNSVASR